VRTVVISGIRSSSVSRGNQDDYGDLETTEVLLVPEVLVRGEKHRKVLGGQQSQQFAIPFPCPPYLDYCADLVVRKFPP
jgi:hypothetical protein